MRRLLRGVRRAGSPGASAVRDGYARLALPGVTITGSVFGPGREVYAGHGARIVLHGVVVGCGCRIATVLRGVRIGAGATVGADPVVSHDVAPGSTMAGIPTVAVRRTETSGGRS